MSLFTYHTGRLEKSSGSTDSKPAPIPEYYTWKKGESIQLGAHFNSHEFDCQCKYEDCVEQKISSALIARLENVRSDLGQGLRITSGYRCAKHQVDLRAQGVNTVVAKKSTHELGDAADAQPANRNMDGFETICAKYFDSIGLAKTFLHLDTRKGKRRWTY